MWRIELERPIDTSLPDQEQIEQLYRYGYLAECNDALAQLLGYERSEQLVGLGFEELAQHADRRLPEQIQTAIHSGYRLNTIQVEVLGPDGTRRQRLRTHWGVVEDGMLIRIWGTVRDITELRRAEEALAATRQRLAELLERVRLVTVMLDNDGSVTFCNDYVLRLTGWQADEVAGKNWFDLMVPPEEREQLRQAFAATRLKSPYPHHFESTLIAKDGRRWLVGWESTILRDSEGRVNGIAGVGRDITAYKALDATVRQARMLESFGRTADKIARDFSDLLVIISGYCAALLPDMPETDPAYRALNEIKAAAESGVGLSQQLMALGRRQMLVPKPLNLNTLIEQVGRTLGPLLGEDITFTLQLDPKLGLIRGDTDQLRQVLVNLALGARDRLPEGGNLIISSTNAELDEQRALQLSGVAPGSYVVMSVTDTGVGMAEMAKAYLFEPLFTMPEEGKTEGLGLSTLNEIVQQNGGLVLVDTELEMQTTFHLYFPRVQLTG
jgi:PAS domain S-box-containing protein